MSSPIRVLLVHDRAIVRAGIRSVLDEDAGIEVVAETSDVVDAVAGAGALAPHLLLAGVQPHTLDTADLVAELAVRSRGRAPDVLFMTNEPSAWALHAFRAGAGGIILNRVTPGQLRAAVHVVAAGYRIFCAGSEVWGRAVDGVPETAVPPRAAAEDGAGIGLLTRREREVFQLLAHGLSNTEISVALVLSENTVKSHVQRLLDKLNLRNRVHAVIHAYQSGLMPPPCPSLRRGHRDNVP
ncbi:LuxR C-terminal-related transcriptional regulator [Streptomyces sp. NPDC004752]